MRESIIFLLFCVIVDKVTAPAPFNLPKTSLPQLKTTTPSTTTKLPKWNDYMSKNSGSKPIKDNAYLATLVNMPPKDKKQKNEINKAERNKTNVKVENNKELLNDTRVLYAEEIVPSPVGSAENNSKENEILPSIGPVDKSLKEKENTTVTKVDFKSKLNNTEPKKGVKLQDLFKPLLAKPKVNNTEVQQKPFEIPPTMIPIFRPNPNLTKNQAKDNVEPILITPQQIISPVKEVPAFAEDAIESNEAKPNLKSNSNAVPFNIPCHRASDILDEVPVKSEASHTAQANLESNVKPEGPNSQEPIQVERPQKLDTDESVAIIFKPKNISLLNVYGDMLKKITLTVLVPYHMSKLGQ